MGRSGEVVEWQAKCQSQRGEVGRRVYRRDSQRHVHQVLVVAV